jgi:hypothetical protein
MLCVKNIHKDSFIRFLIEVDGTGLRRSPGRCKDIVADAEASRESRINANSTSFWVALAIIALLMFKFVEILFLVSIESVNLIIPFWFP